MKKKVMIVGVMFVLVSMLYFGFVSSQETNLINFAYSVDKQCSAGGRINVYFCENQGGIYKFYCDTNIIFHPLNNFTYTCDNCENMNSQKYDDDFYLRVIDNKGNVLECLLECDTNAEGCGAEQDKACGDDQYCIWDRQENLLGKLGGDPGGCGRDVTLNDIKNKLGGSLPTYDFLDGEIVEIMSKNYQSGAGHFAFIAKIARDSFVSGWLSGTGRVSCFQKEIKLQTFPPSALFYSEGEINPISFSVSDNSSKVKTWIRQNETTKEYIVMGCLDINEDDVCDISCCGDGVLETGEECDDGNLLNGDGCSSSCKKEEICDDGIDNDNDGYCDYPTSTCTDGSTPGDSDCVISCVLNNAYWSTSTATEGDPVTLTIEATGCDGQNAIFKVWEDATGEALDGGNDPANINPTNAIFSAGKATTTWIAERENDCNGFCNPPEYFFIANITTDLNKGIKSGLLQVFPVGVCVPKTCQEILNGLNEPTTYGLCGYWPNGCGDSVNCGVCDDVGEQGTCDNDPDGGRCIITESPYCDRYNNNGEDFCNDDFENRVAEDTQEIFNEKGKDWCGSSYSATHPVTGEPGTCTINCICSWDSTNNVCGGSDSETCVYESSPPTSGICKYETKILSGCEDEPKGEMLIEITKTCQGVCSVELDCQGTIQETRKCINRVMLPFFTDFNLIIAIILVIIFYIIIVKKRKKLSRGKPSKRKKK